jgi:hypothetical protein
MASSVSWIWQAPAPGMGPVGSGVPGIIAPPLPVPPGSAGAGRVVTSPDPSQAAAAATSSPTQRDNNLGRALPIG